jgi:hypothetical protein
MPGGPMLDYDAREAAAEEHWSYRSPRIVWTVLRCGRAVAWGRLEAAKLFLRSMYSRAWPGVICSWEFRPAMHKRAQRRWSNGQDMTIVCEVVYA